MEIISIDVFQNEILSKIDYNDFRKLGMTCRFFRKLYKKFKNYCIPLTESLYLPRQTKIPYSIGKSRHVSWNFETVITIYMPIKLLKIQFNNMRKKLTIHYTFEIPKHIYVLLKMFDNLFQCKRKQHYLKPFEYSFTEKTVTVKQKLYEHSNISHHYKVYTKLNRGRNNVKSFKVLEIERDGRLFDIRKYKNYGSIAVGESYKVIFTIDETSSEGPIVKLYKMTNENIPHGLESLPYNHEFVIGNLKFI
jgi:hypothetical protein